MTSIEQQVADCSAKAVIDSLSRYPAPRSGTDPCWRRYPKGCRPRERVTAAPDFRTCLTCPVFKIHAEAHPGGWGEFLAREAEYLFRPSPDPGSRTSLPPHPILDNLPDALLIIDLQFRVTYLNPAAADLLGMPQNTVLGRQCGDILKSPLCGPDCLLKRALETGRPACSRNLSIALPHAPAQPVLATIAVLQGLDGKPEGGMLVLKETSARTRLEDDLKFSEQKYRRIFEGSQDMIFITSKAGAFKDVNQAGVDLLGYHEKAELMALESVDKVYANPIHRKVFQNQIERHGHVKDFETFLLSKDGRRLHVLISGNALRDREGAIIGYEGIIKDITARMDAVRSLQQRHRELMLLNTVAVAMNRTQDLDEILMIALEKVLAVLGLPRGAIFLIEHEPAAFELRVQKGLPLGVSNGHHPIRLQDDRLMQGLLRRDLNLTPKPAFPPFRAALACEVNGEKATVALTCFLITAREKASGFLALEIPAGRELTPQNQHLLGSIANYLGGAIQNTRLLETIHRHREELQHLTAELLHSQESERKRLAAELHDEAGQALTGITFTLGTIEKALPPETTRLKDLVRDAKAQIKQTYQEMRRLSYSLHPALLTDLGLEPALEAFIEKIMLHSGLHIELKMAGFDRRMSPEAETVLYRLSQEALTNTLKHARASSARLSIVKSFPAVIFVAEDDGEGFDTRQVNKGRKGLGLLCMRERAAMLGGRFSLRTSPGQGTRIRVEIPIERIGGEA